MPARVVVAPSGQRQRRANVALEQVEILTHGIMCRDQNVAELDESSRVEIDVVRVSMHMAQPQQLAQGQESRERHEYC